ncbi:MAG: coproporphyrinogen dehydrogenase HemZ [Mogibacterium sp.]|nr:coproporphyrinogen dehydrogenase HemZ [Mogibacterium sp.]
MYRFYLNKVENDYNYAELCRVFMQDDEFETIAVNFDANSKLCLGENSFLINASGNKEPDYIKLELYRLLESLCGCSNEWGTLTGVKPLKLAYNIFEKESDINKVSEILSERYAVHNSKIEIIMDIMHYQMRNVSSPNTHNFSVYIGIPFCPTICAYCSFASAVAVESHIEQYLNNLIKEIKYMGSLIDSNSSNSNQIESIYIGGGTPTTLNPLQLDRLIESCEKYLHADAGKIEFTVEAGRPDTITAEKLEILQNHGISRISINPQSMKDDTLSTIGRKHTAEQIIKSFELANENNIPTINADLIAGLPGESNEDFCDSLKKVIELGAQNITIHTLSVKNGSELREKDPEYFRQNTDMVNDMLESSKEILKSNGYVPYYIYRQKHQIGANENVGYCKPGMHSIYNIRIMEEKQTIIGLGAGAIGKVYYPDEDRLERIANVSNYKVYNERFEEMLLRKNKYYGG